MYYVRIENFDFLNADIFCICYYFICHPNIQTSLDVKILPSHSDLNLIDCLTIIK